MSLPIDKNHAAAKVNKDTKKNSCFANLRILIVDDHPDITDSLAMLIRHWGIRVQVANHGKSALAILGEFNPHIILLDIGMPEMDGYEVAKKIRQNRQYDSIKLVALTGWNQKKDRIKSKNYGFNEHIAKPIDMDDLHELFNRLMDSTDCYTLSSKMTVTGDRKQN